ncbi:MAG: hypothetical protein JWM14_2811 [Chitinophagaceae bacterium]|nr:hypothetical protein [Chitinophagaceae bacterium]
MGMGLQAPTHSLPGFRAVNFLRSTSRAIGTNKRTKNAIIVFFSICLTASVCNLNFIGGLRSIIDKFCFLAILVYFCGS